MTQLLLIEDEPAIRTAIRDALRARGHDVDDTVDGAEGLRRAQHTRYDLIVLDLMLPGLPGFDVLKALREAGNRTPVIVLTARGSEDDRVRGLALGADDYVTKPFSVRELLARVDACLRRCAWGGPEPGTQLLTAPGLTLDLDRLECRRDDLDEPLRLTAREGEILRYLARHRERVVDKQEFLTSVWGYPAGASIQTRTVDNTIGKLRQKIEPDRRTPLVVQTVHGAGWKLGDSVQCDASPS